jgi:hypothetical protein
MLRLGQQTKKLEQLMKRPNLYCQNLTWVCRFCGLPSLTWCGGERYLKTEIAEITEMSEMSEISEIVEQER